MCLRPLSTEKDPTQGAPLSAWHPYLQSRIPARGPLYVPDAPNNRERPHSREPSKCLNGWNHGERLAREAFWLTATRGLKKDSDSAITPVAEAVHIPAHLAPPGSPQAKQLHHLHAQLSLGQSCHRQKEVLRLCAQGCFGCVPLVATLWTVVCQASLSGRGILQAKILEHMGQHWLPYPSRALYFLLP